MNFSPTHFLVNQLHFLQLSVPKRFYKNDKIGVQYINIWSQEDGWVRYFQENFGWRLCELSLTQKVKSVTVTYSFNSCTYEKQKVFLKSSQNSQKNICARVSFLIKLQAACIFIKKETLAQVFSWECCEIFNIIYFEKHRWQLLLKYIKFV